MKDKLIKMLNVKTTVKDELLDIMLEIATQQVCTYINEPALPSELEWIVIKLAETYFLLNGSAHLVSEGVDVISSSFKQGDLLADYIPYLDLYIANKQENVADSRLKKAKFY